jgi:cobalamin biosynthetic protein CobC
MASGTDGTIQHGGNLARARLQFPQAPEPWIDLSTGINPYSYPHSAVPANAFSRLPEPDLAERLKALAAQAYGAPSVAHIVAAPGTQILLPMIAALPQVRAHAAVLSPTYAEHARAARLAGYSVTETEDFASLGDAALAVVVNPNNPTGRAIPRSDLLALAAQMRSKGGLLVVDEAFHDVSETETVADAVADGGLLVLRSFGKFYGMAGVRLGFAIASADVAARLEGQLGPWSVSGPALHVALEALEDRDWRQAMQQTLKLKAARLDSLLEECAIPVVGGTSLFRYVRHERAAALHAALGEAGILVRRFEEWPDFLRLGLPGDQEWERLEVAVRALTL